ncbi:EamA family transporter [Lysobacter sp. TAF61]|uniref:EamA family transporter n=1 Tax=Lysobacter sp. TAF61 TaxID=3233072 RepID=UPI003F947984
MQHGNGLNFVTLAMIIATIAMLASGQVLFKYAAASIDFGNIRSYFSLPLLVALALYGIATIAWLAVLARVPLSVAFPFYGLGFLLVPLLSVLVLGERLRYSSLLGGLIILIGIAISSRDW